MRASEDYGRRIDRLRKMAGEPEDKAMAAIRDAFFATLPVFPERVLHDLFNSYTGLYYSEQLPCTGVLDFGYYLGRVIDAAHGEYDERFPIDLEEEWVALRDAVNEAAGEMDLRTVTAVMQLLIERKQLI